MKKLGILIPSIALIALAVYFVKQRNTGGNNETTSVPQHSGNISGSDISAKESEKAKAPEQTCFAFEYRHTDEAKSKDIEDFLEYSNAFPILHAGVNAKSVCVRVNQKPVPFQIVKDKNKKEEVMIGSVVGPESVIRVSYCVGKASCMEACPAGKKRFMDDMMSGALEDDANVSDDVKSKAKELRALASENKGLNDHSIMRTWITLKKQEWACKK